MILYPDNILSSLDFDLVCNRIARRCSSHEASEMASVLSPSKDVFLVQRELQAVDEALSWLHSEGILPSTEFESILESCNKLKTRGVVLEEAAFSRIRAGVVTYQNIHQFLIKHRDRFGSTLEMLEDTAPLPEVSLLIDKVLDERARVLSSASKDLSKIREKLQKSRSAAARIFERTLKKYREKGLLAEFDESVSEDRRVLAIQATNKSKVHGIFHSSSNKGKVFFLEPAETVEINNEVAQLIDEERLEIRRILRQLGKDLRPFLPSLTQIHHKLIWLDLWKAKALFSKDEACCVPAIGRSAVHLFLKEAYNPALKILNREKGKATLPLDLELSEDQRILVISGPNAGGKTIAMKTLGLLSIMLQSGIPIPVHPDSKMPFFEKIMADIGDSQSIQNELSTYSSKLVKMKFFLENSDEKSLLLIDEFGSGSDPELGSTLAQVFLQKLNSYGVFGIFTTHYNSIKALASNLSGVINAAMLFDRENLSPEYKLEVGNPGSSYTYEVAGKSGIPPHMINEARALTPKNTLNVDQLLVNLQEDKLKLDHQKEGLKEELIKLRKTERSHARAVKTLETKLDRQTRLNEENDRILYWGQRFQKMVEAWLDQKSKKDKKEVVGRFIGMLNQRKAEIKKEQVQKNRAHSKAESKKLKLKLNEPVQLGDAVLVLDTGLKGVIAEIKKDRYLINIGANITSLLSREQFIKVDKPTTKTKKPRRKTDSKNPRK